MNMTGYIPTDEDIAAMVRDLEKNDPENANPEYARQMLIKMKLMYRELGKIDEELLHKEMEEFKHRDSEG
jgi:RNA polymerase-interacting CarD/CdnL/TRCF family regulator